MSESSPLLAIKCLTYNHEPYIRQCLDGFVMQKTDFPFIAIVHDDASTDKTADIILEYAEKYPEIIRPILEKENKYSKHDGSIRCVMENAIPQSVKYIAMCEGDDYWTDPYKLQKQVDYMAANPDCSLTHTAFRYYYQKNKILQLSYRESDDINNIEIDDTEKIIKSILDKNRYRIQTMTVVYRYDMYLDAIKADPFLFSGYFLMGDTQLWVELMKRGKIHYIDDVTSVYRVSDNSVSHSNICDKVLKFSISCEEMRMYICKKYKYNDLLKKCRYQYCKLVILSNIADVDVKLLYNNDVYGLFKVLNYLLRFSLIKRMLGITVLSYWVKKNNVAF